MKKVLTITLSRLHNGEHYEFEDAVLAVFTPTVAANVNLTEQRTQLQQTLSLTPTTAIPTAPPRNRKTPTTPAS